MIGNIKKFSNEVVVEMKKVSWPTKEQLKESTIVVIVVTAIITTLVSIMDWVFTSVMKSIF